MSIIGKKKEICGSGCPHYVPSKYEENIGSCSEICWESHYTRPGYPCAFNCRGCAGHGKVYRFESGKEENCTYCNGTGKEVRKS